MTKQLIKAAKCDVPRSVEVPENAYGVLVWSLGKFGIGMVFLYLLMNVYKDMRTDRGNDADARIKTVQALQEMTTVLKTMDGRLENIEESEQN